MSGPTATEPSRPLTIPDTETHLSAARIRQWLDGSQFDTVERVQDRQSLFNFRVRLSDRSVHVIRNRRRGPLVLTAQHLFGEGRRESVKDLSAFERLELERRVREQFVAGPGLYYFLGETGETASFEDADRIRVERFVYPDGAGQHEVMSAIFEVAKRLAFVDTTIGIVLDRLEVDG